MSKTLMSKTLIGAAYSLKNHPTAIDCQLVLLLKSETGLDLG